MAEWQTIQSSFINGEVSPRYSAAVNSEFIQNAASEITNGVVLLQGNATKRLGTNFSETVPIDTGNPSDPARVWPMFAPDNQEIILVFAHEYVSLFFDVTAGTGDSVEIPTQIQLVYNPSFDLGNQGWDYDGRITFGVAGLKETIGSNGTATLRVTSLLGVDQGTFDIGIGQLVNIPAPATSLTYVMNGNLTSTPNSSGFMRLKVGTTPGASDIATADIAITSLVTDYTGILAIPATSGDVYFRIEVVATLGADLAAEVELNINNILLYADGQPVAAPVNATTPYTADQLEDLHFIQSPHDDQQLFIFHPEVQPHWLYFNGANWVVEPVVFASSPPSWGGNSWPSVATAYQGRLVVSGNPISPETIWASRSNNWVDFVEGGTITSASPFEFTPTERGLNTWLFGHKALLFGNTRDEFLADAQSGILQATDVAVTQHTGYGALRNPQKLRLGHAIALPTNGNETLKLMQFSREAGGYVAPDIMLQAEHLGKRGIRRMFYTRDPHEMLWAVMQDGTLCTMTFNSEGNSRAWSTWETEGTFLDGTAIVDPSGRDVVVLIVQRSVNGALTTQIEYLNNLRDVKDWRYLDSAVRRTITGFTLFNVGHLEGHIVHVFLDGSYAGTRLVGSAEVDLTGFDWQNASIVDVGIGYNFRVKTFPQGTISANIGLAAKKRYSKVGVRGIFSNVPVIQGQRYPERPSQTNMNTTQPQNELIDTHVCDLGTDTTAQVVVEEPLPLRLTVAGIYGKLSGNEL